jgi:hypothetical protein
MAAGDVADQRGLEEGVAVARGVAGERGVAVAGGGTGRGCDWRDGLEEDTAGWREGEAVLDSIWL